MNDNRVSSSMCGTTFPTKVYGISKWNWCSLWIDGVIHLSVIHLIITFIHGCSNEADHSAVGVGKISPTHSIVKNM